MTFGDTYFPGPSEIQDIQPRVDNLILILFSTLSTFKFFCLSVIIVCSQTIPARAKRCKTFLRREVRFIALSQILYTNSECHFYPWKRDSRITCKIADPIPIQIFIFIIDHCSQGFNHIKNLDLITV